MKVVGGLVRFNVKESKVNLPLYVRIGLGLEKGTSVWVRLLGSVPRDLSVEHTPGKQRSELILSIFEPKHWRYLWKFDLVMKEGVGRLHEVVRFLNTKHVDVLVEESLTTKMPSTHEIMIIGSLKQYRGSISNLERYLRRNLRHILAENRRGSITLSPMKFLQEASKKLRDTQGASYELESYGLVNIRRGMLKTIEKELEKSRGEKIHPKNVLIFSDTEEKYISLLFPRPDEDIRWLDITHTGKIGHVRDITDYFRETNVNLLSTFNRLQHMSEQAHFNVIADLTNHPERPHNRLGAIKKDLKSILGDDNFVDLLEREYDVKKGRIKGWGIDEIDAETFYSRIRRIEDCLQKDVRLSSFRVVGNYVRGDENVLAKLKGVANRVRRIFMNKRKSNLVNSFLMCGLSSVGKTGFVEALAEELRKVKGLKPHFTYTPIDLTDDGNTELKLRARIREVDKSLEDGKKVLVLVDEIDTKNANWPFNAFLTSLVKKGRPVVWFFAGSAHEDVSKFVTNLKNKGPRNDPKHSSKDFLNRIPEDNRFSVPSLTIEDRVLIALSCAKRFAKDVALNVRQVEKAAIAHVALEESSAGVRDIRDKVSRAIDRLAARRETVLKYDHLFDDRRAREEDLCPTIVTRFFENKKRFVRFT
jgi:hypothetical protein